MDTDTTGRIYFNTDTLPERDRFPAFCEGMFRHIVGADIVQLGTHPFSGSLHIRRAGAVVIADLALSAVEIRRQAEHIGDGNDGIVVQFWRQGAGGFTQGACAERLESHRGLTLDNAKPAKVRAECASQFCALTIPRERIFAIAPNVARSVGSMLQENPAFRLLSGYLREIASNDLGDHRAAELIGNHLIDLTAFALGGEVPGFAEAAGVRAASRAAVLRAIARDSDDPALNAIAVAQALGITPRYVHLLLEDTGQSFTHHVLAKRLERAAALLRDPRSQHRKIADVATESGFSDVSYFNRAFRRNFGATPTDMRQAAIEAVARRS
jgi:AraC-like DNA-binding protein